MNSPLSSPFLLEGHVATDTAAVLPQSYLLMQVDRPGAVLATPPGLLERAHAQWSAACLNVRISQLHNDVARCLRSLGVPITIEQLTDDRLFSIDIAIPGTPLSDHILLGTIAVKQVTDDRLFSKTLRSHAGLTRAFFRPYFLGTIAVNQL